MTSAEFLIIQNQGIILAVLGHNSKEKEVQNLVETQIGDIQIFLQTELVK